MYSTLGGCNSLLNLKNPNSNEKTNNLQQQNHLPNEKISSNIIGAT